MKRLWVILFLIILGSCDERIEYSLITRVIPSEGGIVNPSSGTYKENAELSVTATHDSTYVFSGWSGSVTSNDNPLSLTMDSDKNLTATFVKNLRLLVLNISGEGLVEKRVDGNLVNDSLFVVGQTIEITAVPSEGYEFSGWSGSIISNDNPLTLTMDVNKELSAEFISTMRSLVLNISGEGLVEKRVDGNLVNDSLFVVGQTIKLTAVPEKDWVFDKWIYPETSINPISVTISKDTTLQVKFMRYFNYKIPSHDWENYSMPWLDLANRQMFMGKILDAASYPYKTIVRRPHDKLIKKESIQYLGEELMDMVWYCRDPSEKNGEFVACNECRSCMDVNKALGKIKPKYQ